VVNEIPLGKNHCHAVHLYEGSMTIDECDFTDNLADFNGGAVFLGDDPYGYNLVNNSLFTHNSCGRDGAAIYRDTDIASQTYLEVRFSNFITNKADGNGGAICRVNYLTIGGLMSVDNCRFISNKATIGGAIYSEVDVFMDSVVLANNTASFGGAMQLTSYDTLFNVTLINNTASSQGNMAIILRVVRTPSNFTNHS
jgi:predicted outer membrane repeat protein